MRELPRPDQSIDPAEAPSLQSLLQFREEFFNSFIETSIDAVLVIGDEGNILLAGGAIERDFGYAPDRVIGLPASEFIHPDDLAAEAEIARRAFEKPGPAIHAEARVRHKDGSWIACESMTRATVSPKGQPVLLINIRNIAERLEAQRRLEEYAETLRRIIDACPDLIAINRLSDGRYVDISPSFAQGGFRREAVLGKTNAELGVWADSERHMEFRRRLMERRIVRNMEADFRNKEGRVSPGLISATITELNGEPCAVAFVRDISKLKQAETELRAAREAAIAASRAKTEFISSVSHDIRMPMNAILGMADLLRGGELSPEHRRYVDAIVSNGNTLLDLINSVLDLAKIESGSLSIESVQFDLRELTERIADTFALRADEKDVELAVRFESGLPDAFVGDPVRIRQILINLVGNAIKFTGRGEIIVDIRRNPGGSGPGSLLFAVSDTGIGVPANRLGAIFAPFTQADSSTGREYGGSGLGLSIVERLAGLMGGKVWAESRVGMGSTFYFTAELKAAARRIAPQTIPELGLHGMRALVVDDSAISRQIVGELLAAKGALVSEAGGAFEGLRLIEEAEKSGHRFKLMLIDCHMPAMDGLEMVRRIRDKWKLNAAVIMFGMSALARGTAEMKGLGLSHYLIKPVKRDDLYGAVFRALAGGGANSPSFAWPQALEEEPAPAWPHVVKEAPPPPATPPIVARPLNILLAEDSPDGRLLIQEYLRITPYRLDEAEDGIAALRKFKTGKYDLVLMDMKMPRLDGYRAVRLIRKLETGRHGRRTPIVALTASVLDEDVRRAREAGCDLHLGKPIRKAMLLEAIAQAVETWPVPPA